MTYEIHTVEGMYGNKWLVIRMEDERIMTEGSIYTCCRWIQVWGPVSAHKTGREVSPRFLESMQR